MKEELTKSIIEVIENTTDKVELKKALEDVIEKAVTSTAATAENTPTDDAALNGTNTPSIQDAATPTQQAAPEATQEVTESVQEEASVEAAPQIDEVKQNEVPEGVNIEQAQGGQVQEISFGDLFQDFSLGSTLTPGPNGNQMSNFKPNPFDYVEAAKNSKNQTMTPAELQELQQNAEAKKES